MMDEERNITVINAPRSFGIMFLNIFSLVPVITALWLFVIVVTSAPHASSYDIFIPVLTIIVPGVVFGSLLYCLPQRYVAQLTIDLQKGLLTKTKKGEDPLVFNLSDTHQIVSKRTVGNIGGTKYSMLFEGGHGGSGIVFEEDMTAGGGHWDMFAEKLSGITGLPLKRELWVEDGNGKLAMASGEKTARSKLPNLVLAALPMAVSLAGAVLFKTSPTQTAFFIIGIATVLVNLGIIFIYKLLNRGGVGDSADNYFLLVVSTFTSVIPYCFFFLFFALLLNDFHLPFGH